jgi:hypothetical protein
MCSTSCCSGLRDCSSITFHAYRLRYGKTLPYLKMSDEALHATPLWSAQWFRLRLADVVVTAVYLPTPVATPPIDLYDPTRGEGTRLRSWLRHCATIRKVEDSIPDGMIEVFNSRKPSGRIVALGSTQPVTEMSSRNISWGGGVKAAGLTTFPPCTDCLQIGEPEPLGTLRACTHILFLLFCAWSFIAKRVTVISVYFWAPRCGGQQWSAHGASRVRISGQRTLRFWIIHSFLFQLNERNMLNTFIYHQLPPTCFGVFYTIFRETTALLV